MNDIKPRPVKRNIDVHPRQAAVTSRFQAVPNIPRPAEAAAAVTVQAKHLSRRATYIIFCIILMFQTVSLALLPVLTNTDKLYALSDQAQEVVGESNKDLAKKLTYDAENKMYQYNKDAAPAGDPGSPEAAIAAAQSSQKVSGGADNYTVDLSADPEKGVTIRDATDKSGSLSVQMIPQFAAREGKQQDDRVVFPLKGMDGHLVYTVKANGLKEDIVLNESEGDALSFSYKLQLPESLEARTLDDGSIGVYSADTTLFGSISFGSDADREKVENARKLSDKTHLVFVIPAPVIVESGKKESSVNSRFELKGDTLTVHAEGLEKASYPLSIDPSVLVTSANDLVKGNVDGSLEANSSTNSLVRSGLSGGAVQTWANTSSLTVNRGSDNYSFTYNGYMYHVGANGMEYSLICTGNNSGVGGCTATPGTLGTWATTGGVVNGTLSGLTAYNGYVYSLGGCGAGNNNCTSMQNDAQYAKINADGTVGAWALTTSFATSRFNLTATAHDGYIYVLGGCTTSTGLGSVQCSGFLNTVQYASLNADGTIGAWAATTSFTTARFGHSTTMYNGYMYVLGGCAGENTAGNCNNTPQDVQYAKINSDGTVGAWTTTTALTHFLDKGAVVAYNGYMYTGQATTSGLKFAQINADGTLGVWQTGTAFNINVNGYSFSAASGYLYKLSGYDNGNVELTNIQYVRIDSAGVAGQFTAGTVLPAQTSQFDAVAYNGYLYQIAGFAGLNATVRYAPINADGSIGAWTATASLTGNRYSHSAVAYEGYMYVFGGNSTDAATNNGTRVAVTMSAQINADGTLGTWTNRNAMPEARAGHTSVVHNGYVYVIAGCIGTLNDCATAASNTVRYATLSAGVVGTWNTATAITGAKFALGSTVAAGRIYVNQGTQPGGAVESALICTGLNNGVQGCSATVGSLGTWRSETSMPSNRHHGKMVSHNGYIYVVAGATNGATALATVIYSQVNADGTLGAWQTAGTMTNARFQHGTAIYNGVLYAVGGHNLTTGLTSVEYAPINNGGSGVLGSWTVDGGGDFTTARQLHITVAHNNYLYVMGGQDGTGNGLTTSYYAPINADGSVGAWSLTSSTLAGSIEGFAYNGYMYTFGGGNLTTTVQYATIDPVTGALGTFQNDDGASYNSGRTAHEAVEYNGYAYVTGGCTSVGILSECTGHASDVQYALICTTANIGTAGCATPGTLGTWNISALPSFDVGRYAHSSVAANGYLYVLAGCTIGAGAGACNAAGATKDVQYAPINSNGTIGAWNKTTLIDQLVSTRTYQAAEVYGGYLYLILDGNVAYAPLLSNGNLGSWTKTTIYSGTGRVAAGVKAHNGYLYMTGGSTSAPQADTQYVGLKSVPRKGTYSRIFDLGGEATATNLLYRGVSNPGARTSVSYKSASNTGGVFGSSTAVNVSSNILATLAATEQRYRQLTFIIDDSDNSVFPDSLGTASTLEDIELYFNAASAQRLRGGKSFTTEQARPLNARPVQ